MTKRTHTVGAPAIFSWAVPLVWVGLCQAACTDPPSFQAPSRSRDVGVEVDDPGDAALDAPAEPETGPIPVELPGCVTLCDRALDCAVDMCVGINWGTAGVANQRCTDVCDDALVAQLEGTTCDALVDALSSASQPFADLCTSSMCEVTCDYLADCALAECGAVGPPQRDGLATDCRSWCVPTEVGNVLDVACDDLITAIARDDPGFDAFCHGGPHCADRASCEVWAEKMTGCARDHCDGNVDPFAVGLEEVLLSYCSTADDCPPLDEVAYGIDDATTCDSPGLAGLGVEPPLTDMCAGTLGVTAEQISEVCAELLACGVPLDSVDACAAQLAFNSAISDFVACVVIAESCEAATACFEVLG